jgi:hypothetical protein
MYVKGNTLDALRAAERAVAVQRTPFTLLNLAVILETMSDFSAAFSLSAEAHTLDPSNMEVACNYFHALLRMRRFSDAWKLSYAHADWQWVRRIWPEWDGTSSLKGKRLLVLSGGGYGDNILFLRWMPRLKALGAHVTFMCPPSMHSLLEGTLGIDRLIAGSIAGLEGMLLPPDYDYFTCILTLGKHFCPTVEDIPIEPYIARCGSPVWRVGFRTRAGEEKSPRQHRSLTLEQLERIGRVLGNWIGLDVYMPTTWKETAATLSSVDLVVTVDTGVAHLAGAMNIPCWVILPGFSASYYGIDGDRNPWYPSQRLFRNGGEGIDNSVAAVCRALQEEL